MNCRGVWDTLAVLLICGWRDCHGAAVGWRVECTFGAPRASHAKGPAYPNGLPTTGPAVERPRQRRGNRRPYDGCSIKDISTRPGIYEGTVRKHIERLYRAVGVNSRAELSNRFRGSSLLRGGPRFEAGGRRGARPGFARFSRAQGSCFWETGRGILPHPTVRTARPQGNAQGPESKLYRTSTRLRH